MAKRYFNDYNEALTFFEAQEQGDRSLGSVRKDLRAELGAWLVQYEPALEFTGKKLIARLYGDRKATRSTTNPYRAAVVAEDANGKLLILSAHYTLADAYAALANHNAGKFVNFNYRKAVTQPIVLEA